MEQRQWLHRVLLAWPLALAVLVLSPAFMAEFGDGINEHCRRPTRCGRAA